MTLIKHISGAFAVAALFLMIGQLTGRGYPWAGAAVAASPQTKQELNNIILSLRAADSAYASGNGAEAQAKYGQAKSTWEGISSAISKKEAREVQVLFDTLGQQLSKKAAPADVKSTISDMIDELQEDIEALPK